MLIICILRGEKHTTSGAYLEYVTVAFHVTPSGTLKGKDADVSKNKCLVPEDNPDQV